MNTNRLLNPIWQAKRFFLSCLGADRKPAVALDLPREVPVRSNGKRVLIVDDDAVVVKALTMKLEQHGYTVRTALDASGAISAVRRESLDCILLDIGFPPEIDGMSWDGFVMMAWLKRMEGVGQIPVVMCTGEERSKCESRALAEGAVGFLSKPVDFNRMLQLVEKATARPASPLRFEIGAPACN